MAFAGREGRPRRRQSRQGGSRSPEAGTPAKGRRAAKGSSPAGQEAFMKRRASELAESVTSLGAQGVYPLSCGGAGGRHETPPAHAERQGEIERKKSFGCTTGNKPRGLFRQSLNNRAAGQSAHALSSLPTRRQPPPRPSPLPPSLCAAASKTPGRSRPGREC